MEHWEQLTRQAQTAFVERAYTDAIKLHSAALYVALGDFDTEFEKQPTKALASVMVSQFNLIDCHQACHDHLGAVSRFRWCSDKLTSLIAQATKHQQQAILGSARQLHMFWTGFMAQHSKLALQPGCGIDAERLSQFISTTQLHSQH